MKIVNIKELAHMPNGTVFSEIVDDNFGKCNGDMDIDGLNILCGHTEDGYFSENSGHFCCVLHMLDYVEVKMDRQDGYILLENSISETTTDTCDHDYDENSYFVVYEESDILKIIDNLTWALNGCRN